MNLNFVQLVEALCMYTPVQPHPDQDIKHFHHPQRFLCVPSLSHVYLSPEATTYQFLTIDFS